MDFITDNYVWFIVGGVILVMIIIGYYAEKTDFGRKALEKRVKEPKRIKEEIKAEKKEKIKNDKTKKEKKVDLNVGINDAIKNEATNDVVDNQSDDLFMDNSVDSENDEINTPYKDEFTDVENHQYINEDNSNEAAVIDNQMDAVYESPVNDQEIIQPIIEEPVTEDFIDNDNVSELNIDVPNLNDLDKEINDDKVVEDDDVWNF